MQPNIKVLANISIGKYFLLTSLKNQATRQEFSVRILTYKFLHVLKEIISED